VPKKSRTSWRMPSLSHSGPARLVIPTFLEIDRIKPRSVSFARSPSNALASRSLCTRPPIPARNSAIAQLTAAGARPDELPSKLRITLLANRFAQQSLDGEVGGEEAIRD
jgi:hypothetical protein